MPPWHHLHHRRFPYPNEGCPCPCCAERAHWPPARDERSELLTAETVALAQELQRLRDSVERLNDRIDELETE
jgi:hypothetical protein